MIANNPNVESFVTILETRHLRQSWMPFGHGALVRSGIDLQPLVGGFPGHLVAANLTMPGLLSYDRRVKPHSKITFSQNSLVKYRAFFPFK